MSLVPREHRVVEALVDLADTLVDDADSGAFQHRMIRHCMQLLDVDGVGLMLADQFGQLQVAAASGEPVQLLQGLQLQLDEGPCVTCFRRRQQVVSLDLATGDERWPRFGPRAAEAGMRSVHALPMRRHSQTIGALNLFRSRPGRLSEADRFVAQSLADIATVGLLTERTVRRHQAFTEQLQTALYSRAGVEQAKGVLAERMGVDLETAFRVLRAYARQESVRIGDVARLVLVGELGHADFAPLVERPEA